jgi:hypothetical protein
LTGGWRADDSPEDGVEDSMMKMEDEMKWMQLRQIRWKMVLIYVATESVSVTQNFVNYHQEPFVDRTL